MNGLFPCSVENSQRSSPDDAQETGERVYSRTSSKEKRTMEVKVWQGGGGEGGNLWITKGLQFKPTTKQNCNIVKNIYPFFGDKKKFSRVVNHQVLKPWFIKCSICDDFCINSKRRGARSKVRRAESCYIRCAQEMGEYRRCHSQPDDGKRHQRHLSRDQDSGEAYANDGPVSYNMLMEFLNKVSIPWLCFQPKLLDWQNYSIQVKIGEKRK